jgi:hypothetical protein
MVTFPIPEGFPVPEEGTPVEITATVRSMDGMLELVAIDGIPLEGSETPEEESAEPPTEDFGSAFDRRMQEAPAEPPPFA